MLILPMHFLPLEARRKPSEQKHWYDPCLLTHKSSQPPLSVRHSSTSSKTKSRNRYETHWELGIKRQQAI